MAVWNSHVEIIIFLDVNDLHARFIMVLVYVKASN